MLSVNLFHPFKNGMFFIFLSELQSLGIGIRFLGKGMLFGHDEKGEHGSHSDVGS